MMETASSYSAGMMLDDKDEDSPAKCRDRRRRRIEMRRMAAQAASVSSSSRGNIENNVEACDPEATRVSVVERSSVAAPSSGSSAEGVVGEVAAPVLAASVELVALAEEANEPIHGTMSISGRSREMEDAVCVRTGLCRPEINGHRPVHYFGVFDGHGGSHVATLCRVTMHVILEEELMRMSCCVNDTESARAEKWREVMRRTFGRVDELATTMCVCGNMRGSNCGCQSVKVALGGSTAVVAVMTSDMIVVANCGDSRAVLCREGRAIPLSQDHKIIVHIAVDCLEYEISLRGVARVADSSKPYYDLIFPQTVLFGGLWHTATAFYVRGLKHDEERNLATRVARTEKFDVLHALNVPDRPDELARIEASGGRVIFVNGARVEGILAMSRAIGDKYLKSVVISEPEVTFTRRDPRDNCLIIASDGLWDMMSNEVACQVACECLCEVIPGNANDASSRPDRAGIDEGQPLYPSRSVLAAALLTRLALGRKSQDNISVIVVNLAANG